MVRKANRSDPCPALPALLAEVCARLKGIPGVAEAVALENRDRSRILELESRYERQALIPLRNIGLRDVLSREAVIVLLKDSHFRQPPGPTLFLVEPAGGGGGEAEGSGGAADPGKDAPCLEAGGCPYRIIGEELLPSSPPARERTMSLSNGFVLYPDRRRSARTPSLFLLPALPFPELEGEGAPPGVGRVVSISPSTVVDVFLRERYRLPPQSNLATLLVGFDRAG